VSLSIETGLFEIVRLVIGRLDWRVLIVKANELRVEMLTSHVKICERQYLGFSNPSI
jgi:hypothetical protein